MDVALLKDPLMVYEILKAKSHVHISFVSRRNLLRILSQFVNDSWTFDPIAHRIKNIFRNWFVKRSWKELYDYLTCLESEKESTQYLLPIFMKFWEDMKRDPKQRKTLLLLEAIDLTQPATWYPLARMMKRHVIYHCGPTNSGKTYNALQALIRANNGIYCSPLRLLAMEVFETVNGKDVPCTLHTGQESIQKLEARHLSCTTELACLERQWEVAVIDEIQMISDLDRGWAWTRAFLGLQATEIHLCGDSTALGVIECICTSIGDEFTVKHYERMKPLRVTEPLESFDNVKAGDCFVVFSRRDIFKLKAMIEKSTVHKCCVIYGALPPQTRLQQAKLLNEPGNGYDVLVATDAIGMGLNLNIERIVFWSVQRRYGYIGMSLLKQIAGRAGRWSSPFDKGLVTCFEGGPSSCNLQYITLCLEKELAPRERVGLQPTLQQLEAFANQLEERLSLHDLLFRFYRMCIVNLPSSSTTENMGIVNGPNYCLSTREENMGLIAHYLHSFTSTMSLADMYTFCCAPVKLASYADQVSESMKFLKRYAEAFSNKEPVRMGVELSLLTAANGKSLQMDALEDMYQIVSMYRWLAERFSCKPFPDKDQAAELEAHISNLLTESLVHLSTM